MDLEPAGNQNKSAYKFGLTAVVILMLMAFGLGFGFGEKRLQVISGRLQITQGVPPQNADYSLLWNVLNELNTRFVDRPLDQQKLLYGAVSGLVNAAGDPYTVFFNPEDSKKFNEELSGTFDGIGAEIGVKNDQIVVIAPLPDTPAAKSGILAGDVILAIDGESTATMSVDTAASKIRGPAGTQVTLSILHFGKRQPEDIKITRAKIDVKSLEFKTKDTNGNKIAIVKMNRFGEDTKGLLDHDIDVILSGSYKGVILDLRGNPGGFLDTAVTTASNWIEAGRTVVKEVNYGGQTKDYPALGLARLKGVKTVVLVNGGSASASEIVAGALQDYGLATLIGEKTFGKGSVQEVEPLAGNSTLKITVAKWYTPKGRGINKTGLEPDVKIELTPADAQAGKDPQMDKALELISK